MCLVPILALSIANPSLCQELSGAGPASVPEQRGYLSASAGMEFEPPTKPVFSVEYGENIHRDVQAYATFSYFENLMTRSLQDELDTTAERLTSLTGTQFEFQGRDRGLVFVAGGKYLIPTDAAIRPYVGGGA